MTLQLLHSELSLYTYEEYFILFLSVHEEV